MAPMMRKRRKQERTTMDRGRFCSFLMIYKDSRSYRESSSSIRKLDLSCIHIREKCHAFFLHFRFVFPRGRRGRCQPGEQDRGRHRQGKLHRLQTQIAGGARYINEYKR